MSAPPEAERASSGPDKPLVVDLDGTLLRTDLFVESLLKLLKHRPHYLLLLPYWLSKGRAHLKRQVARRVSLNIDRLPLRESVMQHLRRCRESGRRMILATAADELYARQVAAHVGLFDEVLASDGHRNLKGAVKAAALVERFGRGGFDYLGDSHSDLPVWRESDGTLVVYPAPALSRRLGGAVRVIGTAEEASGRGYDYFLALRPHQWLKNLLLYLPLLTAHQLANLDLFVSATLGFIAFSLCASGVYLLNDLIDLEDDRGHPRKHRRPMAAGTLPLSHGVAMAPAVFLAGFAVALSVNASLFWVLLIYAGLSLAYTFVLKRLMLLDVMMLAGLYTVRVLAGGAATGISVSFWLLAFSVFLFLSLALVKRYAELLSQDPSTAAGGIPGRPYRADDRWTLLGLGSTSGLMAVLVLALYINSADVRALYEQPVVLWLLCPVLLYWVSRIWLLAGRAELVDDPLLFAVRDPTSYVVLAAILAGMMLAT